MLKEVQEELETTDIVNVAVKFQDYKVDFDKELAKSLKDYLKKQYQLSLEGEQSLEEFFDMCIKVYIATALSKGLKRNILDTYGADINVVKNHFETLIEEEYLVGFPDYDHSYILNFYYDMFDLISLELEN